jgi:hypothetical protein
MMRALRQAPMQPPHPAQLAGSMLMDAPVRVIASLKHASAQTVGQPAQASAGGLEGSSSPVA